MTSGNNATSNGLAPLIGIKNEASPHDNALLAATCAIEPNNPALINHIQGSDGIPSAT
jgi:hypothetical protein